MDFTKATYYSLLNALQRQGFSFYAFSDFLSQSAGKVITLRHDVDKLPFNSLAFARIQANKGIRGTYYFRIVPESFDEKIIREIYSLGHEIGYHYEDVSFAQAKLRAQGSGLRAQGEELERIVVNIGVELFKENLEKLRKVAPVSTICMHGSPMSRWDSRLMWKYYDYRDFGIVGEPYFDANFEEGLYLTDTGRRWDGGAVSVRDKAQGTGHGAKNEGQRAQWKNKFEEWKVKPVPGSLMNMTQKSLDFQNRYKFRSTTDIIQATEKNELPDKIMMTFHPQRWTNKLLPWIKELAWQNIKNVGKYYLVKDRLKAEG